MKASFNLSHRKQDEQSSCLPPKDTLIFHITASHLMNNRRSLTNIWIER